jgi:hypothetical protein
MKPCFVRYGQGLNAFDMNKKVALTGVYSAIDAKSGTLYLLMSLSTGFVLKRSSLRMLMRACATFSRLLLDLSYFFQRRHIFHQMPEGCTDAITTSGTGCGGERGCFPGSA